MMESSVMPIGWFIMFLAVAVCAGGIGWILYRLASPDELDRLRYILRRFR